MPLNSLSERLTSSLIQSLAGDGQGITMAQDICRGIIGRWLEFINAAGGEYPEDDIKREFEKLVSLKQG